MNGDIHARFWESAGVRFPRATHLSRSPEGKRLDIVPIPTKSGASAIKCWWLQRNPLVC